MTVQTKERFGGVDMKMNLDAEDCHVKHNAKLEIHFLCLVHCDDDQTRMLPLGQGVFTAVLCSKQIGIIGGQEDLFIEHNIVSWSRWCAGEVLFIKATCRACFQIWQLASLVLMSRTVPRYR